jgi:hypothetical protein
VATFDTSAADAMLKVVEDDLFDSVVTFSGVIDLYEQNANVVEGPNGRYIEGVNMFGYSEGIGARSESGFLPVPGNPTFVNFRVKLKNTYAVAQMTQKVMRQAMKGKAAFADWADIELTRTEKGLRDDLNRQAIGYGTGVLAQCDTSPTAAACNLKNPLGLTSASKGWQFIRRGMTIIFSPNIDGSVPRANGQSATVLSVSKTGNSGGGTLVLDNLPTGTTTSDYIFRGDDLGNSAPENGVAVEMMGLEGSVDDGTNLDVFQNISRTTYPEWKAQAIDGSAAPYSTLGTDTLFMQMNDTCIEFGGSEGLTHILVTRAVFRNIYAQLKKDGGFGATQIRANVQGGAGRLTMWVGDRQVEVRAIDKLFPGRIFGLDQRTLRRYHLKGFQWDDTTGSIFRQVAVGAGVRAAFYCYGDVEMELGCTDPQKNIRCSGLSESVG